MALKIHGMAKTRIYTTYAGMKNRCNNSNGKDYKNYGGRGITYCKKWTTFKGFYEDMGESYIKHLKSNTTLERKDNSKLYEKSNCTWATRKEQNRNKRNVKIIKFNGMKKCLNEWAEYLGVKSSTMRQRFYVYKWSIDKCFNYNLT